MLCSCTAAFTPLGGALMMGREVPNGLFKTCNDHWLAAAAQRGRGRGPTSGIGLILCLTACNANAPK